MVLESLLGGLLGFGGRIVQEVVKARDRKNERAHELEMSKLQMQQLKEQGSLKLDEASAAYDVERLKALAEAMKGQAAEAIAGGKVTAFLSASVRPVVTYLLLGLYIVAKVAGIRFLMAFKGSDLIAATGAMFGPADMGLLSTVVAYWFVSREYAKSQVGK